MTNKQVFYLKILFSIVVSSVLAIFASQIDIALIRSFTLDLSQIVFRKDNPLASDFLTFRMPPVVSIKDSKPTSLEEIKKIQEELISGKPKIIVYFFTKGYLGSTSEERKQIAKFLASYPNTFLHVPVQDLHQKSISNDPEFADFPRKFTPTTTMDQQLDKKSRRLFLAWDRNREDEFIVFLREFFGFKIDPYKFPGVMEYFGSLQTFMKLWESATYGDYPGTVEKIREFNSKNALNGKMIFFAKWDNFTGFDDTPSVFDIWSKQNLTQERKFASNYTLAANMITNYVHPELTIKSVPLAVNRLWLFLVSICILFFALFAPPIRAVILTTLSIPFFLGTSFLILGISHWFFNFSSLLISTLGIHYISVPTLLIRFLRKQQKEEIEREKHIEIERLQTRLLTTSARSEAEIRVATQVAHDIRSPIMAVKIATEIGSKNLPDEVKKLLMDASDRLQNLANDLLSRYKKGFEKIEYNDSGFELNSSIRHLIKNLNPLFPKIRIELDSKVEQLTLGVPKFQFERALSNLLHNSVEALELSKKVDPVIRVSISKINESVQLAIEDNGSGVDPRILPRLFEERATFGKSSGTGLGLYQVKQTMEAFGGTIKYSGNSNGARFEINLPLEKNTAHIDVSGMLVWVEDSPEIMKLAKTRVDGSIESHFFSNIEEAQKFIESEKRSLTLVTDVIFQNSKLTGFDLLLSIQNRENISKMVCTSLADHKDIQAMANRTGALIISKSDLFKTLWTKSNQS